MIPFGILNKIHISWNKVAATFLMLTLARSYTPLSFGVCCFSSSRIKNIKLYINKNVILSS